MERRFYVYTHNRKSDGTPFYVGKGLGGRAYQMAKRNKYWHNIASKHGLIVQIISIELTEAEAFSLEVETIARFKADGYRLANLTNGGEGTSGRKFSEASRKKISDAHKAIVTRIRPRHSEEAKRKIGAANKGKGVGIKKGPLPDEVKRKISQKQAGVPRLYLVGKTIPEDRKKKISDAITKWHATRRAQKQAAAACLLASHGPSAAAAGRTGD